MTSSPTPTVLPDARALKPCLRCGGPAKMITSMGNWVGKGRGIRGGSYGPDRYHVVCGSLYEEPPRNCVAWERYDDVDTAAAAWNTPPASDAAVPAGEAFNAWRRAQPSGDERFPYDIAKAAFLAGASSAAAAPKVAAPARHPCGCEADPIDGLDYVCDRHLREGGSPLAAVPKVASDACPFCTGASEYQGSPEDAFCERHLRLYRKANAA